LDVVSVFCGRALNEEEFSNCYSGFWKRTFCCPGVVVASSQPAETRVVGSNPFLGNFPSIQTAVGILYALKICLCRYIDLWLCMLVYLNGDATFKEQIYRLGKAVFLR
jgi:hypothetical protein